MFQGPPLDAARLTALLDTPEGIDGLESFTSKFCPMQDTFVDKFLPTHLRSVGELPGSAIDNLRRAELRWLRQPGQPPRRNKQTPAEAGACF